MPSQPDLPPAAVEAALAAYSAHSGKAVEERIRLAVEAAAPSIVEQERERASADDFPEEVARWDFIETYPVTPVAITCAHEDCRAAVLAGLEPPYTFGQVYGAVWDHEEEHAPHV
ncbi:hypothetical protein Pth03_09660 [Planotetraspora thailandica]|uniref:Uncharacterized protein n=1 Tax=Planotetraspora thailandica TaxID=487172 RepID=A0A8J3UWB0_9ACTN|nr:hypothetical protein [Planotetraspora thailandica]GII52577.1 hypothetical protein Pth03_09660 [Planotetraspora thailandica]